MMSSLSEQIEQLNLPETTPPTIPPIVLETAEQLGLMLTLTSPSVPEEYDVHSLGEPAGYIRVRGYAMSVSFPDAGGEDLYNGPTDGFGMFTNHEREAKLLFALALITVRTIQK